MSSDASVLRTQEYKGCGIRAASYKVGPEDWVPEACFWVHSKNGWTRMWVNSFAHFFEVYDLTFANETDADTCAFTLARRLIDKTQHDLNSPISLNTRRRAASILKMLQIARQSLSSYNVRKPKRRG
ncbi:MAG TPA: hypothetical protein VI585_19465 [Candidatus Binatia bacterium]